LIDTITRVAAAVANGLNALHRESLVHGSLKPTNILLGDDSWQLADYSLNFFGDPGLLPISTRADAWFVAPEVLRGAELTPSADVFAFGRVCQWMLNRAATDEWRTSPEFETWRYLIQQTQAPNPRLRPSMASVTDLLFERGSATKFRIIRLLNSDTLLEQVASEIATMTHRSSGIAHFAGADQFRAQAVSAFRRMTAEFDRRPYLAVPFLDGDYLVHYASVMAISTFDNPEYLEYRLGGGPSGGGQNSSSRMQKRISRGLDSDWQDAILQRYRAALKSPRTLPPDDPYVTPEMRNALEAAPDSLIEQLREELRRAADVRATILAEEDLLTTDEALSVLAQQDPNINTDDLIQLEAGGILFAVRDHGVQLYPAFQFDKAGCIFTAITEVNAVFNESSGWGRLVWWRRRHPELGAAPKDMLLRGELGHHRGRGEALTRNILGRRRSRVLSLVTHKSRGGLRPHRGANRRLGRTGRRPCL
jgi:serine/threonine protein kinase